MLIAQTPLRISLAGGGTDLAAYYEKNGGVVVNAAIDKYVYVMLHSRFDDKIYISYSKREIVDHVDDIRHELVREAMKLAGVEKGVELSIMADIPSEGSGLGSSSSLTVGLLNALYAYRGIQVTAERLAEEACKIEIDLCGKPVGKQDQYIAAFGGLRYMEFHPDGAVDVQDLSPGEGTYQLGAFLSLFFTNITRKADKILSEQTQKTPDKQDYLDAIKALAFRARQAIQDKAYTEIGAILQENWALKKNLADGITNAAIDEMVERAMQGGASGCKISGAGGGGFLLTCCELNKVQDMKKALSDYREMPFFLERCGSKIIFNVESYDWK